MLGFSPLASAPLSDDGVLGEVIHFLSGSNILASAPVVSEPSVTSNVSLEGVSIVLGAPTIGSATLSGTHNLPLNNLITTAPTLGEATLSGVQALSSDNILTDAPVFGTPTATLVLSFAGEPFVTGVPSLDESDLLSTQNLVPQNLNSGRAVVDTATLFQEHSITSLPFSASPFVLSTPRAFSQGPFNPNYNKQRVAFLANENRVIIVPFAPRKVTQEVPSQSRVTRI